MDKNLYKTLVVRNVPIQLWEQAKAICDRIGKPYDYAIFIGLHSFIDEENSTKDDLLYRHPELCLTKPRTMSRREYLKHYMRDRRRKLKQGSKDISVSLEDWHMKPKKRGRPTFKRCGRGSS